MTTPALQPAHALRFALSLASRGTRAQFGAAVAMTVVIPLLTLYLLSTGDSRWLVLPAASRHMIAFVLVAMLGLGYTIILQYPITIVRLRRYLQDVVAGQLPDEVRFIRNEDDIRSIETSLNAIISRLRRRIDESEQRQQQLASQLEQAQKLRALGTLAAGIAHELKTPIQFVGDNTRFFAQTAAALLELSREYRRLIEQCEPGPRTQTALARADRAEQERRVALIAAELDKAVCETQEGLQQVSHVIEAMKEFSYAGDTVRMTPADLNRAVESTVTVSRNEWKYVADVELDLDPALPPVLCHAGDIRQVILNMLVNAAHAVSAVVAAGGRQKGHIAVQTRLEAGQAVIRVTDNGCGMDEATRRRVFEPFFTTKPPGKGSGQGLAIAHSVIVRKHGGELTCGPAPDGRGTTFTVRIPVAAAAPAAATADTTGTAAPPAAGE